MNELNISFIGGGNMASSIIGGLVDAGLPTECISVSDPNEASLENLKALWPLQTSTRNTDIVTNADVVVLAVKPQILVPVCEGLKDALPEGCLILSIAAGLSSTTISQALGGKTEIVRCMPNTPALVKQGASVLFATPAVTDKQKASADQVLRAVGRVDWIDDETLMDAVTAVSGSGPAYFFLVIEAMIDAGVELGLTRELANNLALQTALGASQLAINSVDDVAELRRKVTSPKGTTEQAIKTFESLGLRDIFKQAMQACAARSHELGAN